jgi:RimJ/RimL family protein N-acetyltransferase
MLENGERQEWLTRAIGHRLTNEMVGHIGYHGSPVDDIAEIGYTVFESNRRNGYAEEAARGLMEWAQESKSVRRFRLTIGPDNQPSLQLALKLGFTRTGEQIDELDGLEYVFDLDLR